MHCKTLLETFFLPEELKWILKPKKFSEKQNFLFWRNASNFQNWGVHEMIQEYAQLPNKCGKFENKLKLFQKSQDFWWKMVTFSRFLVQCVQFIFNAILFYKLLDWYFGWPFSFTSIHPPSFSHCTIFTGTIILLCYYYDEPYDNILPCIRKTRKQTTKAEKYAKKDKSIRPVPTYPMLKYI